jgi:hypothetical protein
MAHDVGRLQMDGERDSCNQRQQQLEKDPVVPRQAPGCAERLHQPCQHGDPAGRDDQPPGERAHRQVDAPDLLRVGLPQADHRENQIGRHRANPTDRAGQMRHQHRAPSRRRERHEPPAGIESPTGAVMGLLLWALRQDDDLAPHTIAAVLDPLLVTATAA